MSHRGAANGNPPRAQLEPLDRLYRGGRHAETLAGARALQADYPRSPILWFVTGLAEAKLGRPDAAIAAYDRALALAPGLAEAQYNMALAYKAKRDMPRAVACYRRALARKPTHVPSLHNLGNALRDAGDLAGAQRCYRKVLAIDPDHFKACSNLASIHHDLGQTDVAITLYRQVLAKDPTHEGARHLLAALEGETPATAPRGYVEGLFDDYAAHFEQSLTGDLDYRAPRVLADLLAGQAGAAGLGAVLDLGCGTGLSGQALQGRHTRLVGVDLSDKMLAEARAKAIYDDLVQSDLVTFLAEADLAGFDLILAADVLIYVGDLEGVFARIARRHPGPVRLAFTTEHLAPGPQPYQLRPSGRYAHSEAYVGDLCARFGAVPEHVGTAPLRKEGGQFLEGGVYLLRFDP